MNVGIYNRWLATLGGGERYSLAIAQYLSERHSVRFISHTPVSPERIADRLNLDLHGIQFVTEPELPAAELGRLAAGFDLFINASNLDFVPPQAPRNALVVYFPIAAPTAWPARLRRRAGGLIKRWSLVPVWKAGVFGPTPFGGKVARGLAHHARIELSGNRGAFPIRFALASATAHATQVIIRVNEIEQTVLALPEDQRFVSGQVIVPGSHSSAPSHLEIEAIGCDRGNNDWTGSSPYLYLTEFQPQHWRYRLYQYVFETRFKGLGIRLHNPLPADMLDIVAGYDQVWAISQFTQRWIERYWQRDSILLYPPVDIHRFSPRSKRKQILSVGRYFAGNHNKKHDILIEAFKHLVDGGLSGWELHLAGGVMPGAIHQEYLARLRAAAQGYPITMHTDLAFDPTGGIVR